MDSSKLPKPKLEHLRLETPDFQELFDAVRFKGTHLMRNEMGWIIEMAVQTAAKSFKPSELRDNQENFLTKMQELRYVNGHNDVEDLAFSEIQQLWHRVLLDLVDDFNELEVFDYDEKREVLEVNICKITDRYIDLERILYKRARRGPYD